MTKADNNVVANLTFRSLVITKYLNDSPYLTRTTKNTKLSTQIINSHFSNSISSFLHSQPNVKNSIKNTVFSKYLNSVIIINSQGVYDIKTDESYNDTTFSHPANDRGAYFVSEHGFSLTLNNCSFNKCYGAYCGAVYNANSGLYIHNCNFTECIGTDSGSIIVRNSGLSKTAYISSVVFNNCTGFKAAAGIYASIDNDNFLSICGAYFNQYCNATSLEAGAGSLVYVRVEQGGRIPFVNQIFFEKNKDNQMVVFNGFSPSVEYHINANYSADLFTIYACYASPSPSHSISPSVSPTRSPSPTRTETVHPTNTASSSPLPTSTPSASPLRSVSSTPSQSISPTRSISATPSPSASSSASRSISPSASASPSPSASPTISPTATRLYPTTAPFTPSAYFTPLPSASPSQSPDPAAAAKGPLTMSPLGMTAIILGALIVLVGLVANIILCIEECRASEIILEPKL